jgi:hypothetical protein
MASSYDTCCVVHMIYHCGRCCVGAVRQALYLCLTCRLLAQSLLPKSLHKASCQCCVNGHKGLIFCIPSNHKLLYRCSLLISLMPYLPPTCCPLFCPPARSACVSGDSWWCSTCSTSCSSGLLTTRYWIPGTQWQHHSDQGGGLSRQAAAGAAGPGAAAIAK